MDDEAASVGLPDDVVEAATRLTRLARDAVDGNERAAYDDRRDRLLAAHGYAARIREGEDTLVCHPADWLEDGAVRTDRIDDVDAAVEVSLSGADDPDDWDRIDARNRELVDAARTAHGDVHGDTAAAFADFMGNHYARPMVEATGATIDEFCTEYFVRNAWPSDDQRAVLERSIELVFETADRPVPTFSADEAP